MSEKKVVQLTNRNPESTWKSHNRETGKNEFLNMADMDDYHLQAALVVCQKRKVKNFMMFINDSKRESQLKQEAKNRNMNIQDIDYIKVTYLGAKYTQFKDVMNTAITTITRKIKKEEKV